jgi:hypothetical protein
MLVPLASDVVGVQPARRRRPGPHSGPASRAAQRPHRPHHRRVSRPHDQANGALELRIATRGVAWIECDLDGRRDAGSFQAFGPTY